MCTIELMGDKRICDIVGSWRREVIIEQLKDY